MRGLRALRQVFMAESAWRCSGRSLIGVLGQQWCFELLDEGGQAHHFTPPQVMAKRPSRS